MISKKKKAPGRNTGTLYKNRKLHENSSRPAAYKTTKGCFSHRKRSPLEHRNCKEKAKRRGERQSHRPKTKRVTVAISSTRPQLRLRRAERGGSRTECLLGGKTASQAKSSEKRKLGSKRKRRANTRLAKLRSYKKDSSHGGLARILKKLTCCPRGSMCATRKQKLAIEFRQKWESFRRIRAY